ncbi:MAG TPA: polysaccharide deacetylase family protein [Firmicutes bacterium]|nr:polysaccharide deacetylase family protein [Candidatus Fermentithermobacillaceae bacterium]
MIPVVFALVLVFVVTMVMPVVLFHLLGMGVIKRGRVSSWVCLTFDDGPDPRFTPVFLDVLGEYGARATFFCLGEKVLRYPDLARRICEEGHEIGLHGFDHRHPWADPPWRVVRGISISISAVQRIAGQEPRLYRPPWGFWSLWNWFATQGLHRVLWSLPGKDWLRNATPESIVEHIAKSLKPGDVILLHDGGRYSGITVESLPGLLETFKERGLRTVTVSEMIAATDRVGTFNA